MLSNWVATNRRKGNFSVTRISIQRVKTQNLISVDYILLAVICVGKSDFKCVCINPVAVCREYCETPEGKREQKKVDSCATTKLSCSVINNVLFKKIRVFRCVRE